MLPARRNVILGRKGDRWDEGASLLGAVPLGLHWGSRPKKGDWPWRSVAARRWKLWGWISATAIRAGAFAGWAARLSARAEYARLLRRCRGSLATHRGAASCSRRALIRCG